MARFSWLILSNVLYAAVVVNWRSSLAVRCRTHLCRAVIGNGFTVGEHAQAAPAPP